MSKRRGQQTKSITVNVTPEQAAAVQTALERAIEYNDGNATKNELLALALKHMCRNMNVEWPEPDTTLTEGRDNRGRFVKKS